MVRTAPVPVESYLPKDVHYDPAIPRPEQVLGWTVGEWHARHDQIVAWCRALASASPRVRLEGYGTTHEDRPLMLAVVTSPANHARLEALRAAHVESVLAGADVAAGPEVVWLGYGVHGNEPSASNAGLVVLYHLAAATGPEFEAFLERTIIVLDPCLNPDGHDRFAQWANSHRGRQLVSDPAHREHQETWPGGRTNHYWFDLNRDWLLLVHPESRGRVAAFQRWMPCVLTDHHEMGTDSTFFFQPGIPSRVNPLTPSRNIELTRALAEHHADALDGLGSLYFSEENFDDFYYGKGSTYPDIQGCIGILFEQASARGHLQENSYGGVSFPSAIKNQVAVSLSTLRGVDALRSELSAYQRASFQSAREDAATLTEAAYVFGDPSDPTRTRALADLLQRHGISVHRLAQDVVQGGAHFAAREGFIVPLAQPQSRLIRAVFETRQAWDDNTFYDVSSWNLALSFGVPFAACPREGFAQDVVGAAFDAAAPEPAEVQLDPAAVAYAIDWSDSASGRGLTTLLQCGVRARVATQSFDAQTSHGARSFARGTVLVPNGSQDLAPPALEAALRACARDGVAVHAITRGLTPSGVDLGSASFRPLELPRPLLLVGDGVSSYEAGEVWFELDARLGIAVTQVPVSALTHLDLARYTHLLLVTGAASGWGDELTSIVRAWVQRGGVLIATRGAAPEIAQRYLSKAVAPAQAEATDATTRLTYGDYDELRGAQRIAGAIFELELDLTHPLAFGYDRPLVPIFRSSEQLLPMGSDPFAVPARYTTRALLSGYASAENVARIAESPALRAERLGAGTVVCMADDPLFRGIWHGTRKLHTNALFFGRAIQRTGRVEGVRRDEGASELDQDD
ncbi:MAG: M14 family metallopeptidase [Planctomycetota bacterium]